MTNNVGRNDPCPCGSGKKYKKCCLNQLTLVSSSQIQDIRSREDKLMNKIDKFCEQTFNSQLLDDAWGCFVGWTDVDGGDDPTVLPESGHMFNVWRQFHWHPGEYAMEEVADGAPTDILATVYQQKRPIDLKDRDFITAAMSAPFCFYQVVSVVEGKSMVLKNLLTDEQTEVIELRAA
ncbi:MAG: SEC-C domain-containing protein, partial [Algicola sp.]|nr:SEC-C domain-containing protein [Algicola sp.]